jgi:hypothetical protein
MRLDWEFEGANIALKQANRCILPNPRGPGTEAGNIAAQDRCTETKLLHAIRMEQWFYEPVSEETSSASDENSRPTQRLKGLIRLRDNGFKIVMGKRF